MLILSHTSISERETPSRERLEWLSKNLTLWEPLARRLGFSEGDIKGFDEDNKEWAKKSLSMLLKWKEKNGSDASYVPSQRLIEILIVI